MPNVLLPRDGRFSMRRANRWWAVLVVTGLSLLSGIRSQLGATVLAVMMGMFVLLVHIPRVVASPGEQLEWIMLGVALSLSGAAWLVRKYAT